MRKHLSHTSRSFGRRASEAALLLETGIAGIMDSSERISVATDRKTVESSSASFEQWHLLTTRWSDFQKTKPLT